MVSLLWGLWLACSLIGPAHLSTAASQGFGVSATERGSDSCTAVLVLPVTVAASAVLHVCTTDQKPKTHTKKGTETCPNGKKSKVCFLSLPLGRNSGAGPHGLQEGEATAVPLGLLPGPGTCDRAPDFGGGSFPHL